jgi:D-alanyl-D-alanine endopeptidase (penicillin-binding protein 7)
MPEARLRRVSSQRFLPAFKFLAVALCATAFLLPGAQAAKKEKPAAAKTAVAKKAKGPVPVESSAARRPRRQRAAGPKSPKKRKGRSRWPQRGGDHPQEERQDRGGRAAPLGGPRRNARAPVLRPDGRPAWHRGRARPEVQRRPGHRPGHARSAVQQERPAVLPIASLTKLMTGLLISEAKLPMDELITITQDDVDTEKGSSSRLTVGTTLSRGELLHLALMSSENRAAHALGRTYPGGLNDLREHHERQGQDARHEGHALRRAHGPVEPQPVERARPGAAGQCRLPTPRCASSPPRREYQVAVGNRMLQFNNTNRLVKNPGLGNRPAEDRLHLRSRPVPGDAGQGGRPQADHGVPGFGRQVEPHRRRRARAPLGRGHMPPAGASANRQAASPRWPFLISRQVNG